MLIAKQFYTFINVCITIMSINIDLEYNVELFFLGIHSDSLSSEVNCSVVVVTTQVRLEESQVVFGG